MDWVLSLHKSMKEPTTGLKAKAVRDQIEQWESQTTFDNDMRFVNTMEAYLDGVEVFATPEDLYEVGSQLNDLADSIKKIAHRSAINLQGAILRELAIRRGAIGGG